MIALDEFCTAHPVTDEYETECLVLYQARVAEAQQWPAEIMQAAPYIVLLVAFGLGLLLGRGPR